MLGSAGAREEHLHAHMGLVSHITPPPRTTVVMAKIALGMWQSARGLYPEITHRIHGGMYPVLPSFLRVERIVSYRNDFVNTCKQSDILSFKNVLNVLIKMSVSTDKQKIVCKWLNKNIESYKR